jgi:hypothetical protein
MFKLGYPFQRIQGEVSDEGELVGCFHDAALRLALALPQSGDLSCLLNDVTGQFRFSNSSWLDKCMYIVADLFILSEIVVAFTDFDF